MPKGRKISVSFVSELLPTNSNDPSPHNDNGNGTSGCGIETEGLTAGQGHSDQGILKVVQQKLLRVQVTEVILSLILVVLSAVAIIEERVLFSLGFCLVSATAVILAGVIGLQQGNPRIILLVNVLVLLSLIPAFYFTYVSLEYNYHHQQLELETNRQDPLSVNSDLSSISQPKISLIAEEHTPALVPATTEAQDQDQEAGSRQGLRLPHEVQILRNYFNSNGRPRASATIWALGWLQLLHLIPITGCILYKIHLLKFLYYHYYSNL